MLSHVWWGFQGEILLQHDAATEVCLRECRTSRLVVQCPSLQQMEVQNLTASQLTIMPGNLRSLKLLNCSKMSEGSIRACLTRLTGLVELDLSGNLPISDDTLREVGLLAFARALALVWL
jgi:hypothetical protein